MDSIGEKELLCLIAKVKCKVKPSNSLLNQVLIEELEMQQLHITEQLAFIEAKLNQLYEAYISSLVADVDENGICELQTVVNDNPFILKTLRNVYDRFSTD